jgi:hypothetical protein
MRMPRLILIIVALAFALWACSSDNASSSAGTCNTLVNDAPMVTLMVVVGAPPVPGGGMIVDGTYVGAAATLYASAGANVPPTTFSAVIQIAGNSMQQVGTINGMEKRYTSTFTVSGTTVTTSDSCPAPSMGSHLFTATATQISIYDTTSLGTFEQRYTKR